MAKRKPTAEERYQELMRNAGEKMRALNRAALERERAFRRAEAEFNRKNKRFDDQRKSLWLHHQADRRQAVIRTN